MLNHYIMTNEENEVPFVIAHQEEIPFGYPNAGLYRHLQLINQGAHCPDCGFWTTKVHEYHPKQVIAGSHNDTPIMDYFHHRRFVCDYCHRTFMEPLSWLKPYQRMTEIGYKALLHATADRTFKAVGEAFDRSGQNVRVHVLENYSAQPDLAERSTPPLIGIDEMSLAKGKGKYRLVMYDLSVPWRPQLFLMHESRRKNEVIKILQELAQPERVMAVAIDMWRGYKTAVQTVLPEAIVVIDAFHVIQASTKALGDVRKVVQKSMSKQQRDALKRDKDLFAEAFDDLTKEQQERLKQWEKTSPELAQAMHIHQKLRSLYRCNDVEEALELLVHWEQKILDASLKPFQELLKTVWNWLPEILNRFNYRISNAKTEGKNNQVRTMNQQGFGYSINSLQARMQIKEEKTALFKWRNYQDGYERHLKQNESQLAC